MQESIIEGSNHTNKKSIRDRLNLPIHEKKNAAKKNFPFKEDIHSNSNREKNFNEENLIDDEYNSKKHNLQKVFIEDANQEFMMDSTGNLFDMEGNCVGKAQYDDEDPQK